MTSIFGEHNHKEDEMTRRGSESQMSQSERDHHANQNNPNNPAYQDAQDNHANQLNPEHDEGSGYIVTDRHCKL